MAERIFIQQQLKRLETNYGKERFKITQPMFELWAEMFKDLDENGIKASVDEYIKTSEFPPNVASIMKIYNAKNQSRNEFGNYLKSKYIQMCRWYEEQGNNDTYDRIVDYIFNQPVDERKKAIDEMTKEAIEFYHDCAENGEPKSINKFLQGYLYNQGKVTNGC